MPRLAVITGKYGGFRAMCPFIQLAQETGWDVRIQLCDQHLEQRWGSTWEEADKLFGDAAYLYHEQAGTRVENLFAFGAHLALLWQGWQPDIVVVYGDRLDALIGATVAHQMQIPVAHLQAGDISGGIDDETRWAVSQLAHWHFAPTWQALHRLTRLGYPRAYEVGDHHLDALVDAKPVALAQDPMFNEPYLVVHMHPDTKLSRAQNDILAGQLGAALAALDMLVVVMRPCNDLHHEAMLVLGRLPNCTPVSHLPLTDYVSLLLNSEGLVGNSSAVLIDAPFLQVRSLNIGDRQLGRAPEWVPTAYTNYSKAITYMLALPRRPEQRTERGLGDAGFKTLAILSQGWRA